MKASIEEINSVHDLRQLQSKIVELNDQAEKLKSLLTLATGALLGLGVRDDFLIELREASAPAPFSPVDFAFNDRWDR